MKIRAVSAADFLRDSFHSNSPKKYLLFISFKPLQNTEIVILTVAKMILRYVTPIDGHKGRILSATTLTVVCVQYFSCLLNASLSGLNIRVVCLSFDLPTNASDAGFQQLHFHIQFTEIDENFGLYCLSYVTVCALTRQLKNDLKVSTLFRKSRVSLIT